jgi:GNAT superfamily N-acetyltransferase
MWSALDARNYFDALRLLSLIDIVASFNFGELLKDESFFGWTTKRHFSSATGNGILIAYVLNGSTHVYISFDSDMPNTAENEVAKLLKTIKSARIWCRAENEALIELVARVTTVNPSYWAREMSVTKECFFAWNKPVVPPGFRLKEYDHSKHQNYVNLLEETMFHIAAPGTFIAESEELRSSWSSTTERNHFLSLWHNETLVGICHSIGLELTRLAVNQAYRNQGFGYLLLYSMLDHVYRVRNEEGLLCLYVVDSNDHAYKFYLRTGMVVTGHACRFVI